MFRIPTSVVLVVGLVLATCVIAYWSDNLGKKLGKKRISLFGLRPRQTATLISMVSSVAIMLFTLAALMLFSSQVRDAILRVDRLRDSNEKFRRDNQALQTESARLKGSVEKSQAVARGADERAQNAVDAAEKATAKASQAAEQTNAAETKLRSARGQLKTAVLARASAQRGATDAKRGAELAQRRAQVAQANLNAARDQLDDAQSQYRNVRQLLQRSQALLAQAEKAKTSTQKSNKSLLLQSSRQMQYLAQRQVEVQKLEGDLKDLNKRIVDARIEAERAGQEEDKAKMGLVIVGLGQVFAEVVVPPKVEAIQLRKTLYRLLDAGSQAAERLGGRAYVNEETGIARALHLATLKSVNGGPPINESALIQLFINYLSTFDVPVSVRLVSAKRYVKGDDIFEAKLEAVTVNRIYAQGDTIATETIDGSQRDAVIFNRLIALVNDGGKAAQKKGVTPLLSDQNPDYFANGTNEQIFDTLRALQGQGKPMLVRMVAADDIYSVDPMSVKFILDGDSP